jgi:flavin-dependent dehydrogenase
LDWSAPALLAELGLDVGALVADDVATWKRAIEVRSADGVRFQRRPPRWLARWPARFQQTTLHVDREHFDCALLDLAESAGVRFIWDSVSELELDGDRVSVARTRSGSAIRARWFVDASGARRLIARTLGIGAQSHGPPKVALWAQVSRQHLFEGTVLHPASRGYLSWAWDIPISGSRSSVGLVLTQERFRALRSERRPLSTVFTEQLGRLEGSGRDESRLLTPVRTRGYQPSVSNRVSGENWIMAGEAAALIDPLTSYGVTSALRHADQGSRLILDAGRSRRLSLHLRDAYERNVRGLGHAYNREIEDGLYAPEVREALGIRQAVNGYVPFGYLANSLYGRLNPRGALASRGYQLLLCALRAWPVGWRIAARPAHGARETRQPGDGTRRIDSIETQDRRGRTWNRRP